MSDEPVNLSNMFKGLAVQNARITSLNLLHEDPDILGYNKEVSSVREGHLVISPMEIQAYKLEVQPR